MRGALSDERTVCNLLVQLLLGLARAVTLWSKSHRTHDHILLSHLRLPQPGGPSSRIHIPQEQGGPVLLDLHNVKVKFIPHRKHSVSIINTNSSENSGHVYDCSSV
jgi:hypothetical protein